MNKTTPNNKQGFLKLYPDEIQNVYAIFKKGVSLNLPRAEVEKNIAAFIQEKYSLKAPVSQPAAASIYDQLSAPDFQESLLNDETPATAADTSIPRKTTKIVLSLEDYQRYVETTQTCEIFSSTHAQSAALKSLLLAFVCFYRRSHHPTGWIRYDKKNIFYLAGLTKISSSQQEKLTAALHAHCGLDMRVVGSNQPIPCFTISWLRDQPIAGTTDNPLLTLSDMSPEGIQEIISKISSPEV